MRIFSYFSLSLAFLTTSIPTTQASHMWHVIKQGESLSPSPVKHQAAYVERDEKLESLCEELNKNLKSKNLNHASYYADLILQNKNASKKDLSLVALVFGMTDQPNKVFDVHLSITSRPTASYTDFKAYIEFLADHTRQGSYFPQDRSQEIITVMKNLSSCREKNIHDQANIDLVKEKLFFVTSDAIDEDIKKMRQSDHLKK